MALPQKLPKSETLFNAHCAGAFIQRGLVVVECPWAAMRLTQAGISNVVALLGTAASSVQLSWLARATRVLIMLDGDDAGRKATPVLASALKVSTEVMVHDLPDANEPEDLSDRELTAIVNRYLPFF